MSRDEDNESAHKEDICMTSHELTPRQRAIEALEGRCPPGPVPTCELAFGLFAEWLGRPAEWPAGLAPETPMSARVVAFRPWVDLTAQVFRQMDHCIITHWLPPDDQETVLRAHREQLGDEFLYGFPCDGTFGIPDGKDVEEFCFRLADDPAGVHEQAARQVDDALAHARRMKQAGGDVVWMGADYAMNQGPFLSPALFAEFVAPYLKRAIAGYRDLGLYVIKHSDGDINPLLDMIVDARPHAVHSLDSIASIDIREIKRKYGNRVCLIGNVPHGPLQLKEYATVEAAARYALDHGGVRQGGYIYSTSNAVFGGDITGITIEAYRFMLQVRDRYMAKMRDSNQPSKATP
jgi:uroporphyrinogen decarboxylase